MTESIEASTVDELIAALEKIRDCHGGELRIHCYPYDGQGSVYYDHMHERNPDVKLVVGHFKTTLEPAVFFEVE